jgi:uncharacterized linocin/CFP29 family protein
MNSAELSNGRVFLNSATGRWAGEQILKAMNAPNGNGYRINSSTLRTCDTLRRDEWKYFDETVVEEATLRLSGVADLLANPALVMNIPNAMGKTLIEYETIGDMEEAVVSLDGLSRSDNDTLGFAPANVPLPITHKDFNIGLRKLAASRERGEALDTLQVRVSTRKVAEKLEYMLFRGGSKYGGSTIYGYTSHPNRNTGSFGTNGNWAQAAKTGENMLGDIKTMKAALVADGFYGPYWLYIPGDYGIEIDDDFKANGDKSIRERIMEVDGLTKISVSDQLPANNMVMIQATPDVVQWGLGEEIAPIQWDIYGGMGVAFKVFAIQVPVIRAGQSGKSGIFHMS